ncbi:MAG: amidohydrolase [Oscillospiraceae bacterium]|nr:amidohydrolase [Oscillospiraceae bacterium]
MDIFAMAKQVENYVIEQRRWFHSHAELSWQEFETTAHIMQELRDMGLEPKTYDGLTGCYADIKGGLADENSRTILLRADIDALPTKEDTGLPFASQNEGVMHACGHDSHAAMLLGGIKILMQIKDQLKGNVRVLFQGGEETAIGAKFYVEKGILEGVDASYGIHIVSNVDAPLCSVSTGPMTASSDQFTITVNGMACHGGMPHLGHDAITTMAAIIMNLQPLVSRENDSQNASVITIGKVESGYQYNIVAGKAIIHGNVRDYNKEHRIAVAKRIEEVAKYTALAYGCTADIEYEFKTGPVVHDDPEMNGIVHDAAVKLFGEEGICYAPPLSGSDDFAFFNETIPGYYMMLGGRNPEKNCTFPHHHEKFDVDEASFFRGAAMMAQVAFDYCAK